MIHIDKLRALRRSPGMYLPDDRFPTLVAFLLGADAAAEFAGSREFSTWLAAQIWGRESSLAWHGQLVERRFGPVRNSGEDDARRPYDWLTPEQESDLCADTYEYLERFLLERGGPRGDSVGAVVRLSNPMLDRREQEYRDAGVILSTDPRRSGSWVEPAGFRIVCNKELGPEIHDRVLKGVEGWARKGVCEGFGPTKSVPRRMHSEVAAAWTHASQLEIDDVDLGSGGIYALYALLDVLTDTARNVGCKFLVYAT